MRSMHSTQLCTHGSQQLCAHGSCRPWCPSDSAQKALSSLPCSPPSKGAGGHLDNRRGRGPVDRRRGPARPRDEPHSRRQTVSVDSDTAPRSKKTNLYKTKMIFHRPRSGTMHLYTPKLWHRPWRPCRGPTLPIQWSRSARALSHTRAERGKLKISPARRAHAACSAASESSGVKRLFDRSG